MSPAPGAESVPLQFEVIPDGDDSGEAEDSLIARLGRAFPRPAGVTLTVTSLPQHGVERTVSSALALAQRGFSVVPHLPARGIPGRGHLREIVARMHGAGITEVFAVSGDAPRAAPGAAVGVAAGGAGGPAAGDYTTSLELIRDLVELDADLRIGIACYPEGHPHFSDNHLMQHLLERAPFVDKVVTQLCFSAKSVSRFATRLQDAGVTAAFWAGVPTAVEHRRLEVLSERLGVGASKDALERLDGAFDPAGFVAALRSQPEFGDEELDARPGATLAGIHVYTFNEIEGLSALAEAVTVDHA